MTKNICIGCLSQNRKLTQLAEEHKNFWWLIMEQTLNLQEPPLLCWECLSLVLRLERFKRRVAAASDTLATHLHQTPPKATESLSTLRLSTTEHTSFEHRRETSLRNFRPPEKSPETRLKIPTARDDDKSCTGLFHISFRTHEIPSRVSQTRYVKGNPVKGLEQRSDKHLAVAGNVSASFGEVPLSGKGDTGSEQPAPLFVKVEGDSGDEFGDSRDDGEYLEREAGFGAEKVEIEVDIKSGARAGSSEDFNESDEEPLRRKADEDLSKGKRRKRKAKAGGEGGIVTNKKALKKLQQLNVEEGSLQVVELSWEQVEEERQRARESEAYQRLHYKCHDCIVGFNHRSKLENHMLKHEPAAGAARCGVCGVRCRDARALQQHSRRHRLRWRCTRCGAGWSRAGVAADHAARAHGAPPAQHRCRRASCPHVAPSLAALRLHMKSHAARVTCPQCGASLRDRASLRAHALTHLGAAAREHACARCPKRFLFRKACELHMLTHEAPAHLYCHECDMTFKNRMSFYGHMKYNLKHIDPAKLKHECPECGKRFAKAARLREHRAAIHLHLTPERCDHPGCGFACASRPVLRAHRRTAHAADGAPRRRDHVCHTCGKAYTTKSSLAGHLRAHAGSRPLRCARCPAAFAYDAALYNHTRRVHKDKVQTEPSAPLPPPLPALLPIE